MSKEIRSGIAADIFWYSFGVLVPMTLGFIKTPIFTRYFTPEEYGYLSIVSSTFNYLIIFTFSWLASCLWRYYNHYKNKESLGLLYSNILFLYLLSSTVLILVSSAWVYLSGNGTTVTLVVLLCIQTILSQMIELHMVVIRLEGQSFKYNIITACISVSSFILLLFLTFVLRMRIGAVIGSTVVINALVLAYIIFSPAYKGNIFISGISYSRIKEFVHYGIPAIASELSLIVLTSSDRYVIALFKDMEAVGIYNQVYSISEMSIAAMIGVYTNSITPVLFRELESNLKGYSSTLYRYTNIYILYLLPVVVYSSLFSKQIALILLGESFREGSGIMPYIMFTAFIYGITDFIQDILQFSNKLKILVKGFVIAAIVNIALNFMLVPFFSYQVASVTTLAAYIILYIYYYYKDSTRYFHNNRNLKTVFPYILILMAQVFLDQVLRKLARIEIGVLLTIAEGFLFSAIYYGVLMRKQVLAVLKRFKC
jgi:O-antigen/teichoic acid export membrane protein